MSAMAAIKKSQPDVIPLGLDTTNRPFALQSNWPWMATFGADPLGDAKARADSPEMKRYLGWMRELAQNRYIDTGRKIGEFRPLAAQDKVAFIWDQVLLQGVIESASKMSGADFYKRWGVTTQPAGPGGKAYSFEGGHQLVMFADSKQKKAAWTFMQYLVSSPAAIRDYTLGPGASLPPLTRMPNSELTQKLDTPVYQAFSTKIVPTVTTPPYGPAFAAASSAIMAGVQQAVTGTESIDQIAGSIQQQLERR
jgi:multiple sugar transport system substrate-binding protein